MRIGIVGSRPPKYDHSNPLPWRLHLERMEAVKAYVATLPKGTIVVTGGALGVDRAAMKAAKESGLNVCVYYPNWENGRGAGLARNKQIVHNSDRLVAFWDGESRGTKFTIDFATQMGREVVVFP